MNRTILGKRLREERIHCNMTQEQVAEYINVSTTYIGLIERGERSVTLEKLISLAECFHVTVTICWLITFLLQTLYKTKCFCHSGTPQMNSSAT